MSDAGGELDLTPLERTAERAGLGALRARVVRPDPRRDAWFRWGDGELRVSERVVERLRPDDACVLLLDTVLERRRRRRLLPLAGACLGAFVVVLGMGAARLLGADVPLAVLALLFALVAGLAVLLAVLVARAQELADDDTVAWLGEAETLCRALNTMDQHRVQLAGRRFRARPDLHRRAERLVQRHELRLPPEQRTVPPIERRGPDVLR